MLPEEQRIHRRPRTAFFTLESAEQAKGADIILYIQEDGTILAQNSPSTDEPVTESTPAEDKPAEDQPVE